MNSVSKSRKTTHKVECFQLAKSLHTQTLRESSKQSECTTKMRQSHSLLPSADLVKSFKQTAPCTKFSISLGALFLPSCHERRLPHEANNRYMVMSLLQNWGLEWIAGLLLMYVRYWQNERRCQVPVSSESLPIKIFILVVFLNSKFIPVVGVPILHSYTKWNSPHRETCLLESCLISWPRWNRWILYEF